MGHLDGAIGELKHVLMRSRDPFTWMPESAAARDRCTTPGSRMIRLRGLRPFSGSSTTAFCSTTLPIVALPNLYRINDFIVLPVFQNTVLMNT